MWPLFNYAHMCTPFHSARQQARDTMMIVRHRVIHLLALTAHMLTQAKYGSQDLSAILPSAALIPANHATPSRLAALFNSF